LPDAALVLSLSMIIVAMRIIILASPLPPGEGLGEG